MVKKIFLSTLFILSLLFHQNILAQNLDRVAYINSIELLEMVPGKTEATKSIEELNNKYKQELVIMQNDYNKKYSDFISHQNELAESIKLRRMQELYELEKNITAFMKVAQEDIESQEQYLINPLKEKLNKAIQEVGKEENFVCIYDMASSAVAFVTPSAVNANPLVKKKLAK